MNLERIELGIFTLSYWERNICMCTPSSLFVTSLQNLPSFTTESLQVEPYQLREVSRCLLHTILFARALGQVEPREMECEVFDVVYAKCFDRGIENMVELGVEK